MKIKTLPLLILIFSCDNSNSEYNNQAKAPLTETQRIENQKKDSQLRAKKDSLEYLEAMEIVKKEAAEDKIFLKTKAGKIYKKHPEWTREDCKKLANNEIWIGMTLDMLKYKRGLPNHANPSNYGKGNEWQWCWDDFEPSCFYDNNDDGIIDSYN